MRFFVFLRKEMRYEPHDVFLFQKQTLLKVPGLLEFHK